MSNSQWHEDQMIGDRAYEHKRRDDQHKRRDDLDSRLCGALRASGITADDVLAVQVLYTMTAARTNSYRIVSAMRAIDAWLRKEAAP